MSSNIGVVGNCVIVPETYEESALTDAIEQSIAATLPAIPGLDSARSVADRCAALSAEVARSRIAFIATHGSAFDCEAATPAVLARPPEKIKPVLSYQIRSVAAV